MKKHFTWTTIFCLTLSCVFGQTSQSMDTVQIKTRGTQTYFLDGFKVHSKMSKSDSLKILKDAASKLNGYWKSKNSSDIARFNISTKSLSGQMLLPYEKIQQTAPIQVRLTFNRGILCLITPTDEYKMRISDDELTLEENTYSRQKK